MKPSDPARATTASSFLVLGPFELDVVQGELRHAGGGLAALRRQALKVLLMLGRHPGQVIGKDRLMADVWSQVVVAESSLAQAVADIRRCLGSDGHRLVRTVARRGYVLVPDSAGPAVPRQADTPQRAALLSVALLPFVAEGPDPDLPWLARALQGDLSTEVSRLMGSVVAAPDTASRFQGSHGDPMLAAHELGVRFVVCGAMRREGGRIRLNISLVDGRSGLQRWADIFVVDHAAVAQALGDFAIQVERALQPELYRACAASPEGQVDGPADADALAVRAFALWYGGFNRANVIAAIELLQRAVALNPDATRAWAGIGFMTYTAYCQGWGPGREDAQRSVLAAVGHLERLDREAHYTYQCKAIAMGLHAEWARLIGHTRAWTQRHRHPSAFGAHGAVLLAHGEFDEAIAALQLALSLSPRDPFRADWQHRMAMGHLALGRFEQACSWSQLADATNSVLGWPPIACAGLLRLGQADQARMAVEGHTVWRAAASVERLDRLMPGCDARWWRARDDLVRDLRACGALPEEGALGMS